MKRASKSIICCGFTPCVQRILEFPPIVKGAVNRAVKVTLTIGGKGANTARMVLQQGGAPLLVGFAGGSNGRLLEEMLDDEAVGYRHVYTTGETRICQTLVEKGNPDVTELVEEMPPVTSNEWEQMIALFESLELAETVVTVSGKLPAGVPVDAYAQIARMVSNAGGHIIIDAPGEPLLLALEHAPFVVKINDVELRQTCGTDDLMAACREQIGLGAQSVLITRGSQSVFYVDEYQAMEIFPPTIDAVNPVGSGDAVTAGLALELSRGKDVFEGITTGMACGAANALNMLSGQLDPADVGRLRPEVRITPAPSR
jgi:tagatose 6-phosphate kinase